MNSKGFTLLELLVIVGIITTLSSVVLGGYNTGETQFTLVRIANQVSQDLRKAENKAMTGERAPQSFGNIFPEGGYGVYFSEGSDKYILFCDCNNNGVYDPSGSAGSCASSTATTTYPEALETMSLESDAVISNIASTTAISVTFYPPDPIIQIKSPSSQLYDNTVITVKLNGEIRTITVNTVGLIDID